MTSAKPDDQILRSIAIRSIEASTVADAESILRNHAKSRRPVLITGPTGSGKTVLANILHTMAEEQLPVTVHGTLFYECNMGIFTESTAADELFGHVRFAFTDARTSRKGALECAGKGTVFLDEFHHASGAIQSMLLKVIESGKFRRVGAEADTKSEAWIICAAIDPERTLLYELFMRFKQIVLKPLRGRTDDIRKLAIHFAKNLERENPRGFDQEAPFDEFALKRLCEFGWPGNIRQLNNVVEQIHSEAQPSPGVIGADEVVKRLPSGCQSPMAETEAPSSFDASDMIGGLLRQNDGSVIKALEEIIKHPGVAADALPKFEEFRRCIFKSYVDRLVVIQRAADRLDVDRRVIKKSLGSQTN